MNQIWIIRHGQSLSNAGLPTTGPDDNVLTATGEAQAKCVAIAIPHQPDLIVTSPYVRTHLTAQPLLQKFSNPSTETWAVQEFSYLSLPHHLITNHTERRAMSIAFWQRCDPQFVDGERAESFGTLMKRVQETLCQLRQVQGFTVLFSHSTFTKALLWQILAAPARIDAAAMRHFHSFHRGFRVPNASILKLEFTGNSTIRWSNFHTEHIPESLQTPKLEWAIASSVG